jgi:hypothetical protein
MKFGYANTYNYTIWEVYAGQTHPHDGWRAIR